MKNRIKECRQALGLSQNQLAFKAKMTTSAIANYESGVTNPTTHKRAKDNRLLLYEVKG